MNSDNNRLRFHMGCGECLQSRQWIVRCVSGVLLRAEVKPDSSRVKQDSPRREEDRSQS